MRYIESEPEPEIQFDWAKLSAVVHWIIHRYDSDREMLGRTKLHKCLYYADMLSYIESGKPLTGEDYLKQPFGPTARHLGAVLDNLARDGAISVSRTPYFGMSKYVFEANRPPDTNLLSQHEIELLTAVSDFVCRMTANEISELSHAAPWQNVEPGKRIPYFTAFWLLPDEGPSERDLELGRAEALRLFGKPNNAN